MLVRILFISAFYPPNVVGGWEQLVQDINHGLQARGHKTHVLTSIHGVGRPVQEDGVDRILTLESDIHHYKPFSFLGYRSRVANNMRLTGQVIKAFDPEVIFIHVMWNLSKAVAWKAEQLSPGRVAYYIANDWPYATDLHTAYWQEPAQNPVLRTIKHFISRFPLRMVEKDALKYRLDFEHVMCVSRAVKKNLVRHAKIEDSRMRVVYNGVETDLFTRHEGLSGRADTGLSLLYAGILAPHKGVHTAIEAMGILVKEHNGPEIKLSILGSGNLDYEYLLKKTVEEQGLGKHVRFLGRITRSDMPELFRNFDVLIFPSIWEEPLARVMQEAMASGLVVVGTLTGGTGELLVDGETGLTFEPGNAALLARQIEKLSSDRSLRDRLAANGRQAVLARFGMDRMLNEMEAALFSIVSGHSA